MTDSLKSFLENYGMYGGAFLVAFIAGMFPLFSIEAFLVMVSAVVHPTFEALALCCLIAAVGHQIAKTITYYAGVGGLERGKMREKMEKIRPRIDRWNKAPNLILVLGGAIGIPPLWILGFIAKPLMRIGFVRFTVIVFVTRYGRFMTLAAIPMLF